MMVIPLPLPSSCLSSVGRSLSIMSQITAWLKTDRVENYDLFLCARSAFGGLMCCYTATREVLWGEREGICRHRCEKPNCSPSKFSQKAVTAASAKTGKSRHYVVLAQGVFTCYVWVLEPMSTSLPSGSGMHRSFVQSVLEKCPLHCIRMSCANVNRHGAAPTLLPSSAWAWLSFCAGSGTPVPGQGARSGCGKRLVSCWFLWARPLQCRAGAEAGGGWRGRLLSQWPKEKGMPCPWGPLGLGTERSRHSCPPRHTSRTLME